MRLLLIGSISVILGTTLAAPSHAQLNLGEDFSTSTYEDTLVTTADWNTTDGELKLGPLAPSIVATYSTTNAWGVAVDGNFAYLCDFTDGLYVLDITVPTIPAGLGVVAIPGSARDVAVADQYAYVAAGPEGLQVVDVSVPNAPVVIGSFNTPGIADGIHVEGDLAYVADGSAGIHIFDVSDPTTPSLEGTYNTAGFARDVHVSGHFAYVADWDSGLVVVYVQDPTTPVLAGFYDTSGLSAGVWVCGDELYLADMAAGLRVLDVTDPTAPQLVATYNTPGTAWRVTVEGDRAYVADLYSGLQTLDVSNPASPTLVHTYDTVDAVQDVAVSGDYAFLGNEFSGFRVLDVSRPVEAALIGTMPLPSAQYGMFICGDYAYVGADDDAMQVVDVTNPAAPAVVGTLKPTVNTEVLETHVSGDVLFFAGGFDGLITADISDPTNPTFLDSLAPALLTAGVFVDGDHAYLACGPQGMIVVDVTDPTNLSVVGQYATQAWSVVVRGDRAFVGTQIGFEILDISDPTAPTFISNSITGNRTWTLRVEGKHLFLANDFGGLLILDHTNPGSATLVANVPLTDATGVAVSGDRMFVCAQGGLYTVDISIPAIPVIVDTIATDAERAFVSGQHLYVTSATLGLQVFKIHQDELDTAANAAQSLELDGANDVIVRTRFDATGTGSVTWFASGNNGAQYTALTADDTWTRLDVPGSDLLWASTLHWQYGVDPVVTNLDVDWLLECALMNGITDVPDDQGGWLRMQFVRSGYDFADEPSLPVTGYQVHRRIDSAPLIARVMSDGRTAPSPMASNQVSVRELGERRFVVSASGGSFPPGVWESVAYVAALQQDIYNVLLPTVVDSTENVYVVSAHTTTPSVWFVSEPDSGFSVDNLPPQTPQNALVNYGTGSGNTLGWDPVPDNDLAYYVIYRSTDPNFTPAPGNQVETTSSTAWMDGDNDGGGVYYRITAVDDAGNESPPAVPNSTVSVGGISRPQQFALHRNTPNPFGSATQIRFAVPRDDAHVSIHVYDVTGQRVRTLVNGRVTAGNHTALWDGTDDRGRTLRSGVYFTRLEANGTALTRKVILAR